MTAPDMDRGPSLDEQSTMGDPSRSVFLTVVPDGVPAREFGMWCLDDRRRATRWCADADHALVWPNEGNRPTIRPRFVDAAGRASEDTGGHWCAELDALRRQLRVLALNLAEYGERDDIGQAATAYAEASERLSRVLDAA